MINNGNKIAIVAKYKVHIFNVHNKMRTARSKCTIGEIISFLDIFFTMKPINNAVMTPLMTNDHSLSKNNKTLAEIKKQKIAKMSDC